MDYAGKILIIVENLPVPFDTRVWQEANALTEAGYKVSIICPKGKGYNKSFEQINNISIYRHPMPNEGAGVGSYIVEYSCALFWELVLAVKILFKEGFDVIHACNPPDNIFLIGVLFKLIGKKFVFDHHDINPELYEAKFSKKGFLYDMLVLLEKLTYRTCNISIATNESYREIAINRCGMKSENVFIVRSGPDLNRIKVQPPIPELKKGKRFMVGYLGVIGKQEGLDYLINAAHYILREKNRDDILYCIIGSGPYLDDLKLHCTKLGLDEHIIFTGRIPDKEMLEYLNTADVCVNPDEYNEMNDKSTMNKVLEYMALGKPIVQFDLKEGRHSAQDASLYAKNNDYKDLAEKIIYLLDSPALRQIMQRSGQQRINTQLQWTKQKTYLIQAYQKLLKNKGYNNISSEGSFERKENNSQHINK